ncbi:MAG: DUF262 domain-containing protein [Puniceicoccales bacterium]|jgi:hypothetical protein|nr:DUF262 domain-containing protein [Puniceicoccales bacterium]
MNIELKNIKIRDLVRDYKDSGESGVVGYGGKLNIRPAYQREFIYKDKQRDEVIRTVRKNFPLNTMYWVKNGADGYELMDGQQRTLSLCHYAAGNFSVDFGDGNQLGFKNLTADIQEKFLDYELSVYLCEGTDSERLDWFRIINIAGEKLTEQELRNAIYTGPWLADAKRWFSKTGCPAARTGDKYLAGSPIRQKFLETTLDWISGGKIEEYMAAHQNDADANALWQYFQAVISWIERIFTKYRREMKDLPWGKFYNVHKDTAFNANTLEIEIKRLLGDDDVTSKKGIYAYLLTGEEKHLSIRAFTDAQKLALFTRQNGKCPKCGKTFRIEEMEGDHITPWSEGGKTEPTNLQMLCKDCNRRKGAK